MVALSSDLSDVQKNRTDQEEAKRTAEETIERERKEHDEKVSKACLFVCLLVNQSIYFAVMQLLFFKVPSSQCQRNVKMQLQFYTRPRHTVHTYDLSGEIVHQKRSCSKPLFKTGVLQLSVLKHRFLSMALS